MPDGAMGVNRPVGAAGGGGYAGADGASGRSSALPGLPVLRDGERAPIEYDARAHGCRLTDEGYRLPPVCISRK
jgi:hypothetical protein